MVGNNERRTLIWVPIVHTQADMGRLRESVRRHHVRLHGQSHWDEHNRAVQAIWRQIRDRINALDLDYPSVRLYQDGLPVCGQEGAIVGELAEAGSENHLLLRDLMDRGASLEGTESADLLREEYQLAMRTLGDPEAQHSPEAMARFKQTGRALLARRDGFIADRIAETLRPGETGLIFLGLLHDLGGRLPEDIQVDRLEAIGEASTPPEPSR